MHFPPVRDIVRRYSPWLPLADSARRSSPRLAQAVIVRRSPPCLPLALAGKPHGILAPRRPGTNAADALRACSLSASRHAMTCPAYAFCPKVSCKGALIALPGRGCLS